jgi:hypothetical protein
MEYLTLNNINENSSIFFSKEWTAKKKCSIILKKRDSWKVFLEWREKPINWFLLSNISTLISKILWWPTSLFLPEDNMLPIVYDYDGTLGFAHFWDELEKIIDNTISYPNNICEQKYIDFIIFLQTHIDFSISIQNSLIY